MQVRAAVRKLGLFLILCMLVAFLLPVPHSDVWAAIPSNMGFEDGLIHYVPAYTTGPILFYNKTLFDAAGVAYPTADWSWDDFRAAAKKLTNPAKNVYGTAMAVNPGERASAEAQLGEAAAAPAPGVTLVELAIDDAWMRDSGPIVVRRPGGERVDDRVAVQFGFNAWGRLVEPFDSDAVVATAVAEHLGLPVLSAPFVLEGGSIAVDGAGTLVTTERCLLNPNRGPLPDGSPRTKAGMEPLLSHWLGVERVVWLTDGLTDDTDTDGHVDNVVAIPLAAGVLYPLGVLLSPAVGAVLMSLSTIIVAFNARRLKAPSRRPAAPIPAGSPRYRA